MRQSLPGSSVLRTEPTSYQTFLIRKKEKTITQSGAGKGKRETDYIGPILYYTIQASCTTFWNTYFNLKYIENTCMIYSSHLYHLDIAHCVVLPFMCLTKI